MSNWRVIHKHNNLRSFNQSLHTENVAAFVKYDTFLHQSPYWKTFFIIARLHSKKKKTFVNWRSSDKEEQSDVEVRGLEQKILYLDSSVLILNLGQPLKVHCSDIAWIKRRYWGQDVSWGDTRSHRVVQPNPRHRVSTTERSGCTHHHSATSGEMIWLVCCFSNQPQSSWAA